MGDAARAEMAAGTYRPPTRFAPCTLLYKTAASTGFVQGCSHDDISQTGDAEHDVSLQHACLLMFSFRHPVSACFAQTDSQL